MMSFYEFQRQFPDDEACLRRIMIERYGGTELDCPKCGEYGKFYRMTKERGYVCQHCGHHLHPTVGTPMERTHLPLHKWFYAMYLFSTSRHGVAAKELERQLDIPYKTAWRMAHEIRKYMAKVAAKPRWAAPWKPTKLMLVASGPAGSVDAAPRTRPSSSGCWNAAATLWRRLFRTSAMTLQPIIAENVAPGSTVHTDELASYRGVDRAGYRHETVNHGLGEYVSGDSHVNGLEGFWARLKLSIHGTHVHVSRKHLPKREGV